MASAARSYTRHPGGTSSGGRFAAQSRPTDPEIELTADGSPCAAPVHEWWNGHELVDCQRCGATPDLTPSDLTNAEAERDQLRELSLHTSARDPFGRLWTYANYDDAKMKAEAVRDYLHEADSDTR